MSAAFGNSRRSRTRSPIDDYAKKSFLAKVGKSELKLLRVAVRRSDVIGSGPQLPLERSIDDPARICGYVHYRKDESKRPEPPIFGRGIKVNQDFTENRRVFTHEKDERDRKPLRKSRSRSNYRSRSPRNRSKTSRNRSTSSRNRSRSSRNRSRSIRNRSKGSRNRSRSPVHRRATSQDRNRDKDIHSRRNSFRKSRSRSNSNIKSSGRRDSSRKSLSKHKSRSRERRYSSDKRKYTDDYRHYSSGRSKHSPFSTRSLSPHEHEPSCPMYAEGRHPKKSLTPLRPGEYRPGHPDLALRNRNYEDRSRYKRSRSREDLPSTSRDKSSPGRHGASSKTSRRHHSPTRSDRSPVKSDRHRRRSRSPYNNQSPTKRSYKGDRRRSRSPQYGDNMHGEYGYYEGWVPGPRLPAGRGGYPLQPFFAPPFHPRGMIPGPIIPPGHMIVPRMPMMSPYGPYRPHLPIYNSGAVKPKGPRPTIKSATVTSEQDKDGDGGESQVVITEVSAQDKNEDSEKNGKNIHDSRRKNGDDATGSGEGNK